MISSAKINWQMPFIMNMLPALMALTLFAIPISSTAKSICIPLVVFYVIAHPEYRQDLRRLFAESWCKAAFLIFLLSLLACIWSPATAHDKFLIVEKYSKLLYLPLLVAAFREHKTRMMAIHAFLIAMALTGLLSLITYLGFDSGRPVDFVFRNHIMTGHMMVFASYLCAWLCRQETRMSWRILYGLGIILFTYQTLFISTGRTGYVLYALLMVLFVQQHFKWPRQVLFALLLGGSLFALSYSLSPTMHENLKACFTDLENYKKENKNTDIGYRLQFHQFAQHLFLQSPYWGKGTGSFTHFFAQEKPVPSWTHRLLEPHSQYWLLAVEFGALGFAALLFFLVSLLNAILRLPTLRSVALALLLPFILGNFFDSLLLYSGSGYFFLSFMALCLAEGYWTRNSPTRLSYCERSQV
jgi:O-antigen ligase